MTSLAMKNLVALAAVATMAIAAPNFVSAQQPQRISAQEAETIAQEAFIYFYPLVTMDVSRRQLTNIEPGKMVGRGPMNTFTHRSEEHTSELQSLRHLVCRLLLEKKNSTKMNSL